MKLLITGNLGYVGSAVVRQLRTAFPGAELIGLDIGYFAHCLADASRVPEAVLDTQYFADIRGLRPDLLRGVDAVIHLAAISAEPPDHGYEELTLDVNHRAGIRLARYAKAAGVQSFVFASSCSVYGVAEDGPRTELSEVRPLTADARSKVLSEEGLRVLADSSFRVTCLRFATACGMSDRLRLDLILNDFVASAMATGRIALDSDGSPWRPLIDVQDMALAVEWAVGRDVVDGDDFLVVNAGSERWNQQAGELAAAVAAALPGTEISISRHEPADQRSYRVDFSLFRALAPKHQPRAELRATIDRLRDGLAAMHVSAADFSGSPFNRLHVLADLERRRLLTRTLEWVDKPSRAAARSALAAGMSPQVPAPAPVSSIA